MTPEEEVRFGILAAQREGARVLSRLLEPLGLTPAQAEVLRVLEDQGPMALLDLGRHLVCETGSPSRLVSTLVDRGLVDRREAPHDRRRVTLTLTGEGRTRAAAVRAVEQDLHAWIGERLGPDGLAALHRHLSALVAGTPAGDALDLRKGKGSRPLCGAADRPMTKKTEAGEETS